jgi:hypothetical protein
MVCQSAQIFKKNHFAEAPADRRRGFPEKPALTHHLARSGR